MRPLRPVFLLLTLLAASGASAHPGHDERLALLQARIAQSPDDPGLYLQRGDLYLEAGLLEQARADFQRAAELGVAAQFLALHRARLRYRANDLDGAKAQADLYLEAFPDAAEGYELRARISIQRGQYAVAARDLQQHLALLPSPAPGNYQLAAQTLAQLERNTEALQVLDQGIAKLGQVPSLQQAAIALEMKLGHTDRALMRMQSLREPLADSVAWKLDMAELLIKTGHNDQAQDLLLAAQQQLAGLRETPARALERARARDLQRQLPGKD